MTRLIIGRREVGDGAPVYVIAEAGSNHDGSLEKARRLIAAAAEAGADAVKFQLFRPEKLYPRNVGVVQLPSGAEDFFSLLKRLALPEEWLAELMACSADAGVDFLATAFDEGSVDILDCLGVNAHKVASPELTHLPLIRKMARTGKPVILSTGMSELGDIEDALRACTEEGNNRLALLHCTSSYPTPPRDANLSVLSTLRQAFGRPVGLSDHTLDPVLAPALSVALGGAIVEKHFTLDRASPGPDHPFALEPEDLRRMVDAIRRAETLSPREREDFLGDAGGRVYLGSAVKKASESEREMAACDRRSIMAVEDIRAGERVGARNAAVLRAERNLVPGLAPKFWDVIVNRRVTRDVPAGKGILWEDLLSN